MTDGPPPSIRRGSIVWADLDPSIGAEQRKLRPVVVVSNDGANLSATTRGRGGLTVVPLTRNLGTLLPIHTRIRAEESGLPAESKAQAEQIRSLDVSRLRDVVAVLSHERMAEIDETLLLHLGL